MAGSLWSHWWVVHSPQRPASHALAEHVCRQKPDLKQSTIHLQSETRPLLQSGSTLHSAPLRTSHLCVHLRVRCSISSSTSVRCITYTDPRGFQVVGCPD